MNKFDQINPKYPKKIVCPACVINQGECSDGIDGSGKCMCTGNYDGTLCDQCKSNSWGPSCTSKCFIMKKRRKKSFYMNKSIIKFYFNSLSDMYKWIM